MKPKGPDMDEAGSGQMSAGPLWDIFGGEGDEGCLYLETEVDAGGGREAKLREAWLDFRCHSVGRRPRLPPSDTNTHTHTALRLTEDGGTK